MNETGTIPRLVLGLFVSATLHVTALAGYVAWADENIDQPAEEPAIEKPISEPTPPRDDPKEPTAEEPEPLAELIEPEKIIQEGQLEPSPVKINWISAEAFRQLQATHGDFDQAALQKEIEPVDVNDAPIDPTAPMPAPSDAPSSLVARSENDAQRKEMPAMVKASENPAEPLQKIEPVSTQEEEALAAPPMENRPAQRAAAPKEGESTPPGRIEAVGVQAPAMQEAVDNTPAGDPVSAPLVDGARSESIALNTPPLPTNRSAEPMLPEPTPASPPTQKEIASRRTPNVPIDQESNPDDRTLQQRGDEDDARRIAMLELTARVKEIIGSPQISRVLWPTPDRANDVGPRPKGEENRDGQSQAEMEKTNRDPAREQPQPADTSPRPTAAPKDRSETTAATATDYPKIQPGELLVQQGLKVMPARPKISPQARLTEPKNVRVIVGFNHEGKVIKASLLGSTGYPNLDFPIRQSLLDWKAEGDALPKREGELLYRGYTYHLWSVGRDN